MKKILIIFCIIFSLTSCKSFLDIKPYGKTIPKTPEEFDALLNNRLNDIDQGEENVFGNITSVCTFACYSDNLDRNLAPSEDSRLIPLYIGEHLSDKQLMYARIYEVIRDCNIIIGGLKKIKESKKEEITLKNNVLGTSYALRGLAYFSLLRNFCDNCYNNPNGLGVPLVTEFNIEEKPARATIAETVKRCVEDMKTAQSYNVTDPIYRFNNDNLNAFLARIYFWAADYENALKYAQIVLKKYPLLSGEEYKNMLMNTVEPVGNILFKSCVLKQITNQEYTAMISYSQKCPVSKQFLDLFPEKDKDIRYASFIDSKRVYHKQPMADIRSAEMQLIMAESYYHLNKKEDALKALNDLRAKRISDYKPYTMDNLPPVNKDDLIKQDCTGAALNPLIYAILSERRKELFMENDRWYELKRNGKPEFWRARQGRKYTTMKFMYVFPLPVSDLLLNKKLIQNPNYENVE